MILDGKTMENYGKPMGKLGLYSRDFSPEFSVVELTRVSMGIFHRNLVV